MSIQDQYTVEELDRENKELKAKLSELKDCFNQLTGSMADRDDFGNCLIPELDADTMIEAFNKTLSQSLADIKADAVRDYEASLSSFPWTAEEYIEKMIRGQS